MIIAVIIIYYLYIYVGGEKPMIPLELKELVEGKPKSIVVNIPSFQYGKRIPEKFTCDGDDISPQITISNIPDNTKTLLLIMYDPDAPFGTFYHWSLYNIPPDINVLPENIPKEPITQYGMQARNDFGYIGYGGPCPPRGHGTHHYFFLVLALDSSIPLPANASIREVIDAAKDHVIAYGLYMGTYSR